MSGYPLVGLPGRALIAGLAHDPHTHGQVVVLCEVEAGADAPGPYGGRALLREDARRLAEQLLELSEDPGPCSEGLSPYGQCELPADHRWDHRTTVAGLRITWAPGE